MAHEFYQDGQKISYNLLSNAVKFCKNTIESSEFVQLTSGRMEYWNDGMAENQTPAFLYSNIPLFQHSIIPEFLLEQKSSMSAIKFIEFLLIRPSIMA